MLRVSVCTAFNAPPPREERTVASEGTLALGAWGEGCFFVDGSRSHAWKL